MSDIPQTYRIITTIVAHSKEEASKAVTDAIENEITQNGSGQVIFRASWPEGHIGLEHDYDHPTRHIGAGMIVTSGGKLDVDALLERIVTLELLVSTGRRE